MSPRVAVLLPFRNNGSTIAAALGSVLAERDVDLDVLAIDDGSTDAGPEIVAEIARRDSRVRPMRAGGVGIARALALGAAASHAPLVARMDGDDLSLAGRISAAVRLLEADETLGVAATRVAVFCEGEGEIGEGLRRYVAWQNTLISAADHRRELFVESPICHPSVVIRRRALDVAGGFRDPPWAEDYDLWLRVAAAGFGIAKVPEVLFRWRHREGRATFTDPRYSPERFFDVKAHYLAPRLNAAGRRFVVWGAGPTGKRLARALERHGAVPAWFVDIDPRKIGSVARGAPIRDPESLRRGGPFVVVSVGARGARDLIRADLSGRDFIEGEDFLFAA